MPTRAPRLERQEKGCQNDRGRTVPLPARDGLPQPGQQDIQVTDVAKQACQPLQLRFGLLTPWPIDKVLERAELAAQPPDRGSQTMNAVAVPLPGFGVAGGDPQDGDLKSRQNGITHRVVRLETGK